MKNETRWLGIFLFSVLSGCASLRMPLFKEAIPKRIEARRADFRECYAKRPAPRKNGVVTTEFFIEADGKVGEARVRESTLSDPALESCVLATLRTIEFLPTPNSERAQITFPFNFTSP